jgi:hypothetical protein
MSSQTVYFTNPAIITDLQKEVNQSFMTTNYTGSQTVKYSGIDLNNSNYMPKNNQYLDKYTIQSYQVSHVEVLPKEIGEGVAKTLNGVCDEKFIYYVWEQEHGRNNIVQGQDNGYLEGAFGPNTWNNGAGPSWILKVDRLTNKVVQYKHLGDITGLRTTDFTSYTGAGDDVTRGPMCIYDGHLFVTGQGQKYHTIMKIKCSDLSLVWRYQPVYDERVTTEDGLMGQAGTKMRNIAVIPPMTGASGVRSKPMVISMTTSVEYGNAAIESLQKYWDYYTAYGRVFAYTDNGNTATSVWTFKTVPDFLNEGDLLPVESFNLTSTGSVQDEFRIYNKLVNGYAFHTGSTSGTGVAKTDGIQYFMSDKFLFKNTITGLYENTGSGTVRDWIKIDFSEGSANWNACSGAFNIALMYTGVRCDEVTSHEVSLTGSIVPDGNGVVVSISGASLYGHPVTKILYKQQIGSYRLGKYDAQQLNYLGVGSYNNITWDPVTDCLINGSNNFSTFPLDDEWRMYEYLRCTSQGKTIDDIRYPVGNGYNNAVIERGLNSFLLPIVGQASSGCFISKDDLSRQVDSVGHRANRESYVARQAQLVEDFDRIASSTGTGFKYGPRARRALNGCNYALNLADGSLKWVFRTMPTDSTDHAQTVYGKQTNSWMYHSRSVNQDMMPGTTIDTINGTRYLIGANKMKTHIMDLDALNATTLVNVSGDTSNTFNKGIQSGDVMICDSICKYKDTIRGMSAEASFNSLSYNKYTKNLVVRHHHCMDMFTMFGVTLNTGANAGMSIRNYNRNQIYNSNNPYLGKYFTEAGTTDTELITGDEGLLVVPAYYAGALYFYNVQSIIDNLGNPSKYQIWAWNFPRHMDAIAADGLGFFDGSDLTQYGDLTVAGSKEGTLYFIDTENKRVKHTININGGSTITPLIVDGVMYGYGGNSKWNNSYTPAQAGTDTSNAYMKNAKELYMITPYGL